MERPTGILVCILLFLVAGPMFGQGSGGVEMADTLRQSGKIYVVVASLLLLVMGILFFLFRLEKKVQQLEKKKHGKS